MEFRRKYHVVKTGDTLESIQLEYGVTEDKVMEYNPDIPTGTPFVGGTMTGTWISLDGASHYWSITEVSEGHWVDDGNANRTYTQAQIDAIPSSPDQRDVVYDAGTESTGGISVGDRIYLEGELEYIQLGYMRGTSDNFEDDQVNEITTYSGARLDAEDRGIELNVFSLQVNCGSKDTAKEIVINLDGVENIKAALEDSLIQYYRQSRTGSSSPYYEYNYRDTGGSSFGGTIVNFDREIEELSSSNSYLNSIDGEVLAVAATHLLSNGWKLHDTSVVNRTVHGGTGYVETIYILYRRK